MTEKRFEVVDDYTVCYDGDYFDLHKPSNIRSLVTVSNYVVEENEQLKQELKDYSDANAQLEERCSELLTATSELGGKTVARGLKIQRLEEENEQLKKRIKGLVVDGAISSDGHRYVNNRLSKENEQLKKELKLIKQLKNCDVNEMLELQEENEQLKQSNLHLQNQLEDYATVESENIEFREENENLKKEIKAVQQENLSMIDFMNNNFNEHTTQKKLNEKIEHLETQIKIFEIYLDANDLDIEWGNFCTKVGECWIKDVDYEFDCKDCGYLGIGG